MGTTLTTLSLYGIERSEIELMLDKSDLLRANNSPWLTIVPPYESAPDCVERLSKTARHLTKESNGAALLFFYFDDEMFSCELYENGRKIVSCDNGQSWAKLGKKLGELFGDNEPSKAFRYASQCDSLDEQLKLLEETVGAALYDTYDEEPRKVSRCDKTLREIKAREALLRKRQNKFHLSELDPDDWPEEMKRRQVLFDILSPKYKEYNLYQCETDMTPNVIPGSDGLLAYTYTIDYQKYLNKLLIIDEKSRSCRDLAVFPGTILRAVWQTKSGETVIWAIRNITVFSPNNAEPQVRPLIYCVICLDKDGVERWRFEPEPKRYKPIQYVHTSESGIITLLSNEHDPRSKLDTIIWQINGENGDVLRTRSFSREDLVDRMIYVETEKCFLLIKSSPDELILLDEELYEIRRVKGFEGFDYNPSFREFHLCGNTLWEGDIWNRKYVKFFDLRSGVTTKTTLETPAYPISVLNDGRILGIDEKVKKLTVFDREGNVAARFSMQGTIGRVFQEEGKTCISEIRYPDDPASFLSGKDSFEKTSLHIWQLEPVDMS